MGILIRTTANYVVPSNVLGHMDVIAAHLRQAFYA